VFTVRVQKPDLSHTLTCAQYTVTRGEQQALTLYPDNGPLIGQTPIMTVALDESMRVYVMNDKGNTVDTLRFVPRHTEVRR
jgi:hypothetical protein